jgi:hypothetical protein
MINPPVDDFHHQFNVEIFGEDYYTDPSVNTFEPIYRQYDKLPLHPQGTFKPKCSIFINENLTYEKEEETSCHKL